MGRYLYAGKTYADRLSNLAFEEGLPEPDLRETFYEGEDDLPCKLLFRHDPKGEGPVDCEVKRTDHNVHQFMLPLAFHRQIGNNKFPIGDSESGLRADVIDFYGDTFIAQAIDDPDQYQAISGFLRYNHVELVFSN